MATPVPTLVGNVTADGTGTITIPNTAPPAVGDLLVAFVGAYQSGGSRTWGTPATGFSGLEETTTNSHIIALYLKVATAGDVAAANFAFTVSSASDVVAGALFKVTNFAATPTGTDSEVDSNASASFTETTNLTPTQIESIIMVLYSNAQNDSSGGLLSGYASTPSLTWSELLDTPNNSGSAAMGFGVAYANISGLTTITVRTATSTSTPSETSSIALIINGLQNAAGTAALLVATPVIFAPTAQADTNGTSVLLEANPVIFAASGDVSNSTQWENTDKPSAGAIVNTDKP